MTVLLRRVFAGLTDANQSLIDRALALMNDVRLSTLEPLRATLMAKNLTIRVGSAEENMFAPALFVNLNDGSAGQVVLRSDDLQSASDAAVLEFIDNLVYAGLGHGGRKSRRKKVWARQARHARRTDITPGSGPTERRDLYLFETLNDEVDARFQSWLFRAELNTLTTSYTASNRAVLANNVHYQRFARTARDRLALQKSLTGCERLDSAFPVTPST